MASAYQYTSDGYFAGTVEDYGFLPNNATHTPPKPKDGHIPMWDGEKWTNVENHMGKQGYVNGEPHTVNEYGPLPQGWSATEPEKPLAELKRQKRADILRAYDAAVVASLTMPSLAENPSAVEIALALDDFKTDDPEGWAWLRQMHEQTYNAYLAAVDAAEDAATVAQINPIFNT